MVSTSHSSLAKLAFLLVLATLSTGASRVYRWTDAAGKVHYGDAPPIGATSSEVAPPVGTSNAVESAAKPATDTANACQQSRDKLDAYTKAGKITQVDAVGKSHDLSPDERQKLLDAETKNVAQSCAAAPAADAQTKS